MKYWLHRITNEYELSRPLLFDKGILTIGFSDFTSSEFIENFAPNKDMTYLEQQCEEIWGKNKDWRIRYDLKRFFEFKKGDIVIVPTPKAFTVCEIIDDKTFPINEIFSDDLKTSSGEPIKLNGVHLCDQQDAQYDLGFARKVKILHKNISRAKFADASLTSRMKIRSTSADINDLAENIQKAIKSFSDNKPINLHSAISNEVNKTVLSEIKKTLSPDKFEQLIKNYFTAIGADDVTTPPKNESDKEGDADIIATFENIKLIIYVQAKSHHGTTRKWAVEQIKDYRANKDSIDDGYNKVAWVISTADTFDQSAMDIATENEVQLINGNDFVQMILESGISILKAPL